MGPRKICLALFWSCRTTFIHENEFINIPNDPTAQHKYQFVSFENNRMQNKQINE